MKILSFVSKIISEQYDLDETETRLFNHGLEVLLCDGTDFLSIIFISFFLRNTLFTLLYIVAFSLLRCNAGGWHASTRVGCLIIYTMHYLIAVFIIDYVSVPLCLWYSAYFISVIYIFKNCPVQHPDLFLLPEEIHYAKIKTAIILSCYTAVTLLFSDSSCSKIIIVITAYTAFAMAALKVQNKYYGN